ADGSLSRPGNRPTWQLESPAARLALRAGLAVAAAGALFLALPALHAQLDIRASQANAAVHNLTRASAYAHAAVRAEPFSADAYQQLGLIQEQQRRYDLAARSMGAAARHGVQNYATWLLLSRIDTERGAISAALKDYRRAHKLAPRASVFTLGPYFKP
ncbi:MAG: hypothetical protein J2O48_10190, partial [Solirubrobacterales bacterium]|nr:hypothetical protein [Solirubrobacterales bacterium]